MKKCLYEYGQNEILFVYEYYSAGQKFTDNITAIDLIKELMYNLQMSETRAKHLSLNEAKMYLCYD